MRNSWIITSAAAVLVATTCALSAAVKDVPYPAVKVELGEAYTPDAAFEKLRKAFAEAVQKKDAQALAGLVGPTFLWLSEGDINEQFDFGRDALHNFKVVFGFREAGKDADGAVPDGPFWDTLVEFSNEKSYYRAGTSLVCGPTAATIADENAFERAKQRIGADESIEWYFAIADTPAMAAPGGAGTPVGRVNQVALPVVSVHPPQQGQSPPPVTHLQVLLPIGKRGWIPVSAARPLVTDRLCYALTAGGDWKISAFDQSE
jgi:hypothetical protein